MKNSKVTFVELTQAEYDASLKHSDSILYFTTDTNNFYKGDNLLNSSGGSDVNTVTFTTEDGGDTFSSSDTFEELYQKFENSKPFVVNIVGLWDNTVTVPGYYRDDGSSSCLICSLMCWNTIWSWDEGINSQVVVSRFDL